MRGGEEEENLEGLADVIVKIFLEKKVPEKDRDIFWDFYQTQIKERKGFRRFSTSTMAFWDKVLERITEISRDRKIKSLEYRVKTLKEENEELRKKIKELEREKAVYKVCVEELSNLLNVMMSLTDKILDRAVHLKKESERYRKVIQKANKALDEFTSVLPDSNSSPSLSPAKPKSHVK